MSRIRIMDTRLSNQIAAGEVIERPASVVKELVENSLDAGAKNILVEIEHAGNRLIAVTDDGCGMDEEDALLALQPHGTSKIYSAADLPKVLTLGFRGEAIPSIASVSRMRLLTRTPGVPGAVEVTVDAGGTPVCRPAAAPVGTRMEVRDLFYNLPARKKFLKSPATEEHHIEEALTALAIGHPQIGFTLNFDGRVLLQSAAGGTLERRLREIFGKNFTDNVFFFQHAEGDLHLSGCVGAPGFTRASRREQRLYVNNRAVEAQAVYRGIRDGYGTLAESGRYYPTVIFLDMPPEEVDVNVHPAKREVRFKAEYIIQRAVSTAIAGALRQTREPESVILPEPDAKLPLSGKLPLSVILDTAEIRYDQSAEQPVLPHLPEPDPGPLFAPPDRNPEPDAVPMPETQVKPAANPEKSISAPVKPGKNTAAVSMPEPMVKPAANPEKSISAPVKTGKNTAAVSMPEPQVKPAAVSIPEPQVKPEPEPLRPVSPGAGAAFTGLWPKRILGVIDCTYIVGETENGLVLIDQHAAHERIMFEHILNLAGSDGGLHQPLLFPEVVELSRPMLRLLAASGDYFRKLGFDVEEMGETTVMVNSIPLLPCRHREISRWLTDTLEELAENSEKGTAADLELVARAACKAAIKAHDELTPEEITELVSQLQQCRQGTLCPHGRPTLVAISRKELEKRFFRK